MSHYQTSYQAEVDLLVEVMGQKPEGVLLNNEEIMQLIKLPFQDPRFRSIVNQAVNKLGAKKIPVQKMRGIGIVRISPGDAVDRANRLLGQSHRRAAKKTFKQLQSVELAALSAHEQTVYIAAGMKAQMAVNLSSDANHILLTDEIKATGNKPIDVKATCLRLLDHNR
jgi:hypothetical protein